MSKRRNRKRSAGRNDQSKDYIERVAEAAKEADERLEEPEDTAPWDTARIALSETQELNFPPEIFARLDENDIKGRGLERIDEPEDEEEPAQEETVTEEVEEEIKRVTPKQKDTEAIEAEKREIRRARRIRNQIIAYVSLAVVLLLLGFGIFMGVRAITRVIKGHQAQKAEEEAAVEAAAEQQEEIVVQAPETSEPEPEEDPAYEEQLEEMTADDYLNEMVTSTISQMPVEDKVAQLFMITPEALTGVGAATKAGEGTRDALVKYAVGGLIYDRKNIEDEGQFTELLNNTRNMSKYELFIGVKEPGGKNSTLAGSSLADIPAVDSPSDIAATGDSSNANNAGVTMSSYLSYFGINLNLAPNGSVTRDEKSVSADESYGSDEAVVYEMVAKMIEGLQTGTVNACMTDFPGTGSITDSTAKGRVESELSADDISAEIVPYITGVASGAKIIQTNNVTYINADEEAYPASLSKYVIGTVLRGNMGFDGVVITGPLNESAVTEYYTSDEAALYAYAAGADILYMPEDFEAAYEAILAAVQDGTIPESRIDQSLERIFRIKMADYVE
ncbi:MAG: beta-N-acetylhexosaminidase [Lachnospiraceae bacterium]|nr:beta-N-acetylhexosaminidase [Lachnospiraceae bacterium]